MTWRPCTGPASAAPTVPRPSERLYRERFGREVTIGYGLTEAPTAVTMTDPGRPRRSPESAGRALPHVRLVIVDERDEPAPAGTVGEICVAPAVDGPFAGVYTPMLGYWGQPDASADALRGGMLHTGDLGELDADGELYVRDRRNDLIIRGGANVYPAEVERVLHEDARVAACAVVGVPDERLGERVVAFVETAGGLPVDPDELPRPLRREPGALQGARRDPLRRHLPAARRWARSRSPSSARSSDRRSSSRADRSSASSGHQRGDVLAEVGGPADGVVERPAVVGEVEVLDATGSPGSRARRGGASTAAKSTTPRGSSTWSCVVPGLPWRSCT